MASFNPLEMARYIHDTVKLIHERSLRIMAEHMRTNPEGQVIGELSMQQLQTLTVIRHQDQVSITELASVMNVSPPSASAMVDRLMKKGLLTREPHPRDRRMVDVRVAPIYEAEAEKIESMIMQVFVHIVKTIGPDMAEHWYEMLSKIKDCLNENVQTETANPRN